MTKYVTLRPSDYDYPDWLPSDSAPKSKPTVKIAYDDIKHAANHGVTWDQLEKYYTVHQTTLQKYFLITYSQAEAELQINVLDAMVKTALTGNPAMLKWLSSNWLGMSEKSNIVSTDETGPVDEKAVDNRLEQLIKKYNKKVDKDEPAID